jgi:inner membrane protein
MLWTIWTLNKQNPLFWDYCKTTAFNIILWNANVATTASYLLADYSIRQSIYYYIYYLQQEQSFRIAVKWEFRFWKTKESEGWYIVSQKINLYTSVIYVLVFNDNPENPQFAFSYEFIATESG